MTKTGIALHKYVLDYHYTHRQEDIDKAKVIAQAFILTGLKEFCKGAECFILLFYLLSKINKLSLSLLKSNLIH